MFNNLPKAGQEILKRAQQASGGGKNNGPSPRKLFGIGAVLLGAVGVAFTGYHSLWTVNGGHRGVMFNRVVGVRDEVYGEGTHVRIPWFEEPTIFDIRTKPKAVRSPSGTKDLQMVDITLRVLYKPEISKLPKIFSDLGTNYDERILPSIVNETLKSVIAQFNASQLITQREQVSQLIKRNLVERAQAFNIIVDDVSITHLTFGTEYAEAVESKQVAQQEAERAKFLVKQALQDKRSTIIKAQGEAASAELIGSAVQANPGYLELRQLDAAKHISEVMAKSNNKVYLDSDSLLLNITATSESAKRFGEVSAAATRK